MKIVIDTNVIASAIFFGGKPKTLIELLVSHQMNAYVTDEIVTEYKETLTELVSRYPAKAPYIPIARILACCKLISTTSHTDICRDPDDNKFIECALDSRALYIVSGDKDLLSIGSYAGISILTVAEFLEQHIP